MIIIKGKENRKVPEIGSRKMARKKKLKDEYFSKINTSNANTIYIHNDDLIIQRRCSKQRKQIVNN